MSKALLTDSYCEPYWMTLLMTALSPLLLPLISCHVPLAFLLHTWQQYSILHHGALMQCNTIVVPNTMSDAVLVVPPVTLPCTTFHPSSSWRHFDFLGQFIYGSPHTLSLSWQLCVGTDVGGRGKRDWSDLDGIVYLLSADDGHQCILRLTRNPCLHFA